MVEPLQTRPKSHYPKGCLGCLGVILIGILAFIGMIVFPHDDVVCIEYINTNRELLTVSPNGVICVYTTGIKKERYRTRLKESVKFATYSPNKTFFAIVDQNENVHVFNTKTLDLSTIESPSKEPITDVVFSSDSDVFCIFNDHKVTLYQTDSMEKRSELMFESNIYHGTFCYHDTQLWILTKESKTGKRILNIYTLSENPYTVHLLAAHTVPRPVNASMDSYFDMVVSGSEGIPLILWDNTIYWHVEDRVFLASRTLDDNVTAAVAHAEDASVIIETSAYKQQESEWHQFFRNVYRWDANASEIHQCGSFLPYRDESQFIVYLPKRQAVLYTYIRVIRILHLQSGIEETIPLTESQINHNVFYPFCISDDERFMAYFYQNRTVDKCGGVAEMSIETPIAQDSNADQEK